MTDPVEPVGPDPPQTGGPAGPPPRVGAGDPTAMPGSESTPPWLIPDADQPTGPPDRPDGPDADDEFGIPEGRRRGVERQLRTLLEWIAVAVGALLVALLIKAFLLQAFYIPSGSMEPTLSEGDRVLVNKLSYRFGDVGRGDVIVFAKPSGAVGDINDLIKRVIALPGETITLVDGSVFIDGSRLAEGYLDGGIESRPMQAIPGCDNDPVSDRCIVPADMVFVMGDNRTGSTDSRRFGPIDEGSIVGRAFLKVWPLNDIGFL